MSSTNERSIRSLSETVEDIGKVTIVLTALILLVLTEVAIVHHKWQDLFGIPTPPPLPFEPETSSAAPPGIGPPPPCMPILASPSRSGTRRAAAPYLSRLLSQVGPLAAMRAAFDRAASPVVLSAGIA